MPVPVEIVRLPHAEGLPLPGYASPGAAGMDLSAAVTQPLIISPGATVVIPTGMAIALGDGYEAQVRPRSGLAANHAIGIINSPGTIDSDYRGEIMVILTNFSAIPYTVSRGDRIAQLVVARHEKVRWQTVPNLPATGRSKGGLGHSGR